MNAIRNLFVIAAAAGLAACAPTTPIVSPAEPHGIVISQATEVPRERTHPVHIVAVNGVSIPLGHTGPLYVAPGLHTFRLSPIGIGAGHEARDVRRRERQDDVDAYVDINVQPGMRYVVGARLNPDHLAEWRATITRVEVIS